MKSIFVLVIVAIFATNTNFGQNVQGKKWGIGILKSYETVGFIGTVDVGYNTAIQVIVSPLGDLKKYAIRGSYSWYDYGEEEKTFLSPYAFVSIFNSTYSTKKWVMETNNEYEKIMWELNGSPDIENSYGVEFGGGLLFYPKNLNDNLPAFSFFLEPEFIFSINQIIPKEKTYGKLGFIAINAGLMYNF